MATSKEKLTVVLLAFGVTLTTLPTANCFEATSLALTKAVRCGSELVCHPSRFHKCAWYFTKCVVNEVFQVGNIISVGTCLYDIAGDMFINWAYEGYDVKQYDVLRIVDDVLECMGLPAYTDFASDVYKLVKELHRKIFK